MTAALRLAHGGGAGDSPAWREPMPEFILPDLDDRPWSLADHRGKVVLMNFWATWCPQSRYEAPGLVRLSERFSARGLDAVGVSLDSGDPLHVREWVSRYQIRYPILIPPEHSPLLSGVTVPLTLLIDRQGHIARRYYGTVTEAELSAEVERLMSEGKSVTGSKSRQARGDAQYRLRASRRRRRPPRSPRGRDGAPRDVSDVRGQEQ
jgi:cytochrome c biogenesis protein CcmG, thiol:disulfide interchange protein DsbE